MLWKEDAVAFAGPDDRKPEVVDLDRRDGKRSAEAEIRFGRPDGTLFPKRVSSGCQAPEAVPKWPERVIDCFDSHVAFIAQGHVEVPPDEDWPEIRSGLSEHIQDFPAGFRNVVECDRIVRNAQRKAGGGPREFGPRSDRSPGRNACGDPERREKRR